MIGGTAYAVGANLMRTAVEGVHGSEDARMRLRQSGFDKGRKDELTPQVDYLMAAARKNQEEFNRIPAAAIADAAVEQLNAIKANNGTYAQYEAVLKRIASNAQIMSIAYKDPHKGAENARQLERLSQNLGQDVNEEQIGKIHNAAMRAAIATGGEMQVSEMVRVTQQLGSSIAKAMSPEALLDIFMIREEGGKASTAEWRTAIQEVGRGSLNKKDKALMVKHGLRDAKGNSIPEVINESASNLVKFTEDRIRPILQKAGKDKSSSAEIATFLDEKAGFSTTSARAFADIITSLNNFDLQRQRAAASYVDLDPHLGDKTFRGGTERMKASFETAMGRALDKSGGAFTEAIAPFSIAMDKAGKSAEKGDYSGAALEMTKGVAQMMGGPAGAIITAVTGAQAIGTLLDPNASPMAKGAAMLITGSSALLTAAGAISNYFGGGADPNKDLAHQQTLQKLLPDQIKNLQDQEKKAQAAVDADPSVKNKTRLANIKRAISVSEISLADVERQIPLAQARADAANAEVVRLKSEEAAEMDRLRRESGLGADGAPVTPAAIAATSRMSAEALKQLQQLGASGALAGVKSITDLLKALNQPTSVKSREELATSLGYKGPLGGSAAMNAFLLKFFKDLANAKPEPPPVTPTTEPVKVEPVTPTEPPKVEPVTPPEPPKVEPPKDPIKVEPVTPPAPTEPAPVPPELTPPIAVTPTAPLTPPGAEPLPYNRFGPVTPPVPAAPVTPPAPRPISEIIDPGSVSTLFNATFQTGATTIGNSGTTVGSNAATLISASGTTVGSNAAGALNGQAGSIGAAIGAAAAARISAATVNVQVPSVVPAKASTGEVRAT